METNRIINLLTRLRKLCVEESSIRRRIYFTEEEFDKATMGYSYGLCALCSWSFDSTDSDLLIDFIKENQPEGLPIDESDTILVSQSRFFWPPGDWQSRIEWIDEQIEKLKQNGNEQQRQVNIIGIGCSGLFSWKRRG